jgi:hypothetical protein
MSILQMRIQVWRHIVRVTVYLNRANRTHSGFVTMQLRNMLKQRFPIQVFAFLAEGTIKSASIDSSEYK